MGIASEFHPDQAPNAQVPAEPPTRVPHSVALRQGRLNLPVVAVVLAMHGLALAALTQPFEWRYLPVAVGIYAWAGFGVAIYYHRTLTHKGMEMVEPLKAFFALGTAIGMTGDPVGWVGFHRQHHAAADAENDIHSPRHGLWFAHAGWIFRVSPELDEKIRSLAADVRQSWYCRLLEHKALGLLPHLGAAAAIYATLGLGGLLWGLYVPVIVLMHLVFAINSVCHIPGVGHRSTETRDDSRNVPWLALLTFGEAYHNNHHANPRRAKHGVEWHEIDPAKYVIWVLERLRLVRNVAWR